MWATPWHERSAVAAFSAAAAAELGKHGYAVEIIRTEVGERASLPAMAATAPVLMWHEVSVLDMRHDVDAMVINFGDDYSDHGAVLENFADAGALGIFHDSSLAGLARQWAAATSPDPYAKLRRMVDVSYEPQKVAAGASLLGDIEALLRNRTMVEWFAAGLCGAVVHDHALAASTADACPGPVTTLSPTASSMTHYVEALLAFIGHVTPRRPLMLTGQALGQTLASFGVHPEDPSVARIGMVLSGMFGTSTS